MKLRSLSPGEVYDYGAEDSGLEEFEIHPALPLGNLAPRPAVPDSWVLKGYDIVPEDERTGRDAGFACAASATADVVDAIVVTTAVRYQAAVVTSDLGEITA